ncbi:tetratricopeptide repeat protein [Nitrospina watsonii]|uniref:TPR_REGION domain-containing protein n=1 Tax=Nitrospina watsonii TaxID=1323948 RepID=A0ABN8VWN0_9BACT|nr:tetratricopeptide repeat protein [Nitrospina watsonii]CAI2717606.1 putative TPR_REGION domain-containing protein [Nitrospina watsonii]
MIATDWFLQGKAAQATGCLEEAIDCYNKVLDENLRLLGEFHPDVALVKNSLGTVWFKKGEYERAVCYLEDALKVLYKICSPDHPMLAEACSTLGKVWSHNGDMDKAIQFYEQALIIYKKAGLMEKVPALEKKVERLFQKMKESRV